MVDRSNAATEIAITIKCSKCGREGESVWERWQGSTVLIDLPGGFYERVSKKSRPLKIELVCDGCGAIQPSPKPPKQLSQQTSASTDDPDTGSQSGLRIAGAKA